ncbi:MAG: acyl-CoA thioesterase [Caldilineaceae bacterium]
MDAPTQPARRIADTALTLTQFMQPEHANSLSNRPRRGSSSSATKVRRHRRRPARASPRGDGDGGQRFVPLARVARPAAAGPRPHHGSGAPASRWSCAESEDLLTGEITHTNSAYFVYVALDDERRPTEVPRLTLETVDERRRFEEGRLRQQHRLSRR